MIKNYILLDCDTLVGVNIARHHLQVNVIVGNLRYVHLFDVPQWDVSFVRRNTSHAVLEVTIQQRRGFIDHLLVM